jgi:cytochrome c oxidase subunit 2
VRRTPLAATLVLLAALALPAAALADGAGFTPVEPKSPNAERINESYLWISIYTAAIFVLVQGSLIYFVVRFRRGKRPADAEGPQIRGNTNLEIAWTVFPVLILVAIGSFLFYKLPGIADVPEADAAGERIEVKVEGRQFFWQFEYPDGAISIDELVVPVDRVVRLEVTAPDHDVIHSWWIPALGGKFDAIPGTVNVTWFQAEEAGTYQGYCAEFCGFQHAEMKMSVRAVGDDEYEEFLAAHEPGGQQLGQEIFDNACSKCHGEGLAGTEKLSGQIIPALTPASLSDEELIARVVTEGRGAMPAVGKGWSEEQLESLTSYLSETFGGGQN